jgi:hypothetical protein
MTLTHVLSWSKRILLVLFGLVLTAWILAWVFEDRLGRLVLSQLEQEVQTSLEVGDFQLSFIRAFPRIRGSFDDVLLLDTRGDTLLELQKLAVRLGWAALWSEMPQIDALILEKGTLRLAHDAKGNPNYLIFGDRKETDSASTLQLDIRQAIIRDVAVFFNDESTRISWQVAMDDGKFKLQIKDNAYIIEQDFDAHIHSWKSAAFELDESVTLLAKGTLRLVPDKDQLFFNGMALRLAGLPIKLQGLIEYGEKIFADIEMQGEDLTLATCWRLFKSKVPPSLSALDPKGKANLSLSIKGVAKGKSLPGIHGELMVEDGRIRMPGATTMEDLSLHISLDHPAGKTTDATSIHIHRLTASVGGEPLEAQGKLTNLRQPVWELSLKGRLPAFFIASEDLTGEAGFFEIETLQLRQEGKGRGLYAEGHIRPEQVQLRYKTDPIHLPGGRLSLSPQAWELQDLTCLVAGSELLLNATLTGIPEYLLNSTGSTVGLKGQVTMPNLDLTALLDQLNKWQDEPASAGNTTAALPDKFEMPLRGELVLDVNTFTYEDIRGKHFHGRVRLGPDQLILSGDIDAMGGHFNLEGELTTSRPMVLEGALTCEKVDVREAFTQCRDFGQDFITRKHIKGTLSTQVAFRTEWDSRGQFIEDKLKVYAAVQIDNGELVNFEVLESLSDYVHVKDLRHVKFTTLQNYLEVDRGMIYLPRMLIQSNALALDVTGVHTFDQRIDYGMRVDAGQVLIHKITKHDHTLSPKPNKKKGWFNLYYHIGGTVDDYKIRSDRPRVKGDFVRSAGHRTRIRAHLLELFGDLIFTEDEGEEEVFAAGASNGFSPQSHQAGNWGEMSGNRPSGSSSATGDGEYLEDFEIEGGAGRRRN